ncbi:protoporphyrinogen oxidase [Chromobacterium sp. IIBBL 290-4]|uniref:protoporphyrinogen oxidase n=1 Tax=Chromobacterium sp. IIBBL 290-4 TaxID=2953890 RepID=UPI0020B8B386|nr:protoporphyrinogen oxidase [Chromobacterium sp. IIBBL 290-4]UTH73011.1 protoporphyrinogen oxidase [Chromobacterium sp. IIBBL 290-4]
MIAIIGAGVSGLSCAWWLRERGARVTVFETGAEVGGKVRSEAGEALREAGPHTLLADEELLDWMRRLGLSPVWPDPAGEARHVLLNGRYRALPSGALGLLGGNLLSWGGKLDLLRGILKAGSQGEGDLSLEAFCRARFGDEAFVRLLEPAVNGIFAGDARELVLRETMPGLAVAAESGRSLWRGMLRGSARRRRSCYLSGGLQQLPRRLARDLDVRLNAEVTALRRDGEGWLLRTGGRWEQAEQVVLALPAKAAAALLHPLRPEVADICRRIPYAAMAVVSTLLEDDALEKPLPGAGALHPSAEESVALGHLLVSNSYPEVCDKGYRLMSSFIGGRRHPERLEWPDERLLAELNRELEERFGLRGSPAEQRVVRWREALPQGTALQGRLRSALAPLQAKGLHVCANWLDGVSLADCLRKGRKLAEQLA